MKGLETGKDKVQRICDALRKETLEPAEQEAKEIIENAHLRAEEIVLAAQKKGELLLKEVEKELSEKKKVFQSSLQMACRQGIEELKQKIEEEMLDQELATLVTKEMGSPKMITHIIDAFFQIVQDKGIEDEFLVAIPKSIPPREISSLLANKVMEKLQHQPMNIGEFAGGVQISLKGRKVTIDVSDEAVRELIATYIRRDFRDLVFHV